MRPACEQLTPVSLKCSETESELRSCLDKAVPNASNRNNNNILLIAINAAATVYVSYESVSRPQIQTHAQQLQSATI